MKLTCPYLSKPCIEAKCAAWLEHVVEENGQVKAKSACVEFFWKPLYLKAIANRTDGTQKTMEEFRNEVHNGNKAFGALLSLRQERQPLLGDNSEQ